MRRDSLKEGDKFSKLTVISFSHSVLRKNGKTGERVMNCICECGESAKVRTSNLRSGNTKSCGCHQSKMTIESNKNRGG